MRQGNDASCLKRFARETGMYWRKFACPRCVENVEAEGMLCRRHLIEELFHNRYSDVGSQGASIDYLCKQLTFFSHSFRWESRGSATTECKASLISVAGWLGGWKELINLVEKWR
ncbi:MAG: hypothetical protein WB588_01210 [Dehalococcoidia bacterium]